MKFSKRFLKKNDNAKDDRINFFSELIKSIYLNKIFGLEEFLRNEEYFVKFF